MPGTQCSWVTNFKLWDTGPCWHLSLLLPVVFMGHLGISWSPSWHICVFPLSPIAYPASHTFISPCSDITRISVFRWSSWHMLEIICNILQVFGWTMPYHICMMEKNILSQTYLNRKAETISRMQVNSEAEWFRRILGGHYNCFSQLKNSVCLMYTEIMNVDPSSNTFGRGSKLNDFCYSKVELLYIYIMFYHVHSVGLLIISFDPHTNLGKIFT